MTDWEVLDAHGLGHGRVAEELDLAPSTVKRHLANVYRKTGVGPRVRR